MHHALPDLSSAVSQMVTGTAEPAKTNNDGLKAPKVHTSGQHVRQHTMCLLQQSLKSFTKKALRKQAPWSRIYMACRVPVCDLPRFRSQGREQRLPDQDQQPAGHPIQ